MPKFLVKIFLDGLAYFIYLIDIEHKRYAKANLDLIYKDTINEHKKLNIKMIEKDIEQYVLYNLKK